MQSGRLIRERPGGMSRFPPSPGHAERAIDSRAPGRNVAVPAPAPPGWLGGAVAAPPNLQWRRVGAGEAPEEAPGLFGRVQEIGVRTERALGPRVAARP